MKAASLALFIMAVAMHAAAVVVPPPRACSCDAQADARGLPLVELRADHPGDTLAVLISGDGGWRAIDRDIAAGLNARGVSVVGLVSPKYFATKRTPEEASCALLRIMESYSIRWRERRVIVGGYSRGAGVAPFMINRLPDRWRDRIVAVALIGLEPTIGFEVSPIDLLRTSPAAGEIPVREEVQKLHARRVLCFYGDSERDSLCRQLSPGVALSLSEPGGHHLTVNHDVLAREIWRWSQS